MNIKYLIVSFCLLSFFCIVNAQIVINEGSNKNYTQIADEDNEYDDWIEIYNSSDSTVNIGGWSLSDDSDEPDKWIFPNINLAAKQTLLVFASGKDRKEYEMSSLWESPVLPSDDFQYLIPTNAVANWNTLGYNADSWETGTAGFGYDDNDDETQLADGTLVVYIRKTFSIPDTSALIDAICHVDYDDGFVAYLNGVEICRSNVDGTPTWNSTAAGNHEAVMYNGNLPEAFALDMELIRSAWKQGENVFAAEVHNVGNSSSDLSLIPYLSFKVNGGMSYFSTAPNWLSGSSNKYLHTNFKISSQGETIYIYNAQKNLISALDISNLSLNHSVGRATDGSDEFAIFDEATPGASNNTSVAYTQGYAEMPTFSIEAGFYSGSQNLDLSALSSSYEIRYTTDGSTPDENSTLYTGTAITIGSTQSINARCFGTASQLPSKVKTATYLINEDFTIPVLSVTTDAENLFGSTGIFTNYNQEWNKPCYIEYFDENKELAISQASGIQVDGGAGGSRSKPQTSFRIEPGNSIFGDGDVKYNFHPERPNRDNYASLYLRNGSNRYLDLIYKDAAQVRGMGKNTYNFYSEYRPIIVFINGGYYGMYEGREKINADYLESNYGMDTDSLNMVGISHFNKPRTILPIVGTTDQFKADYTRFLAMDPSSANYLEEVGKILDLDNYTDYLCGQTWMTNKDWPQNNMKAWRCKGSGMRWQFALVDLEWSFLPTGTANLATRPNFDQIAYMNGNGTTYAASGYWYKLMQNEDYKHHFINRMCDLMNTSYDYSVLNKIETNIFKEAQPEIPAYYLRWDGPDPYDFWSNHETFNSELSIREEYARQHLRDHYGLNNDVEITLDVQPAGAGKIKISTIVPDNYPWEGGYFSDVPITFEAIPGPGYTFKDWDNNKYITNTTSNVFTSEISDLSTSFTANFEPSQSTFDGITISEINYKDGSAFNTTDWFEIWNSTSENLSLDGWYFCDNDTSHRFDFKTGLSIPANERLVVVKSSSNFSGNYPEVTNFTGDFSFGLGTPSDEINLYNQSDELVVSVQYSDIYPWVLYNNLSGKTLELMDPLISLNDADNWFAGCFMGSPGSEYDPDCGSSQTSVKDQIAGSFDVQAYPNPVQNNLTLEFYVSKGQGNTIVRIYNVMGTQVFKGNYDGLAVGSNELNIDVSDLKNGQMYFVSVTSNGLHKTIKLIKE